MTCRQSVKEKVLSFMSYFIIFLNQPPITCAQICSLINHLLPNPLLPDRLLLNDHSPIVLYPR